MLPDYITFKELFNQFCTRVLRAGVNNRLGPFLSQAEKRRQFEGNAWEIRRGNAAPEGQKTFSSRSALSFQLDEIPTMTLQTILERIDKMAEEMARSTGKGMFSAMDTTLERHGRTFKGSLTPEGILTAIRNTEVSFGKDGHPSFQLVVAPSQLGKAQEAASRLVDDPDLNKQFLELMAQKWEEWRARETDRGLDE